MGASVAIMGPNRIVALAFAFTCAAFAVDPGRYFTGHWLLDSPASNTHPLGLPPELELTVRQQDVVIQISMPSDGPKPVEWFYSLTPGAEARYKIGAESYNSVTKWEGAALLVNTIVTGPQNYTVMDRWHLSGDLQTLTIVRQVVRRSGTVEGTLVYRKADPAPAAAPPTVPAEAPPPAPAAAPPPAPLPAPVAPPEPAELVIPAGTRISLSLRNNVDTRHSREGDHVYLQTAMPIAAGRRIVIPQGSFVNGTLMLSKPAGEVRGKNELFIHFDALVLPNGVTRDLRGGTGATSVLLSRRTDVVLPQGTSLEMTLDGELRYTSEELARPRRY